MQVKKMYDEIIKLLLDKFAALIILIISSPVWILVFLLLLFSTGGKPFFFHTRIGKNEVSFTLFKFRTMKEMVGQEKRVTRLGAVLRKCSIDELPQLLNVLNGEMSLVGPRPLLVEYLTFYTGEERVRHEVKPGITGWAQVNGRNQSSWEQRMRNDQFYVANESFLLDLKILMMTFFQLFKLREADFDSTDQETFAEFARRR